LRLGPGPATPRPYGLLLQIVLGGVAVGIFETSTDISPTLKPGWLEPVHSPRKLVKILEDAFWMVWLTLGTHSSGAPRIVLGSLQCNID